MEVMNGKRLPAIALPLGVNENSYGTPRHRCAVVVVGQRKALAIAVRNNKTEQRFSGLLARLIA
jgi:hypothetical protein